MQTTVIPNLKRDTSSPSDRRENDEAEEAITPLLSRANLLRIRGQWEEAVAVCTEALRRAPHSAAAHALLGDIYAAQNKSNDAIHWYHMAVDRNPQQPGVAEKLERLLATKRATINTNGNQTTGSLNAAALKEAHRAVTGVDQTAVLPTARRGDVTAVLPSRHRSATTAERTLEWFDRIFLPGQADRTARILFAISGVVAFFVLIAGSFLYLSSRKTDNQDMPSGYSVGEVRTVPPSQQPVVIAPTVPTTVVNPTASATPATNPPAANTVTPPPVTTTPPAAATENTLLKQLSTINSEEMTVTAAQTDAAGTQAQLEIALASLPGQPTDATRARILQAAARVSQEVTEKAPVVQRILVRVLLRTTTSAIPNDSANANLVFVGETNGSTIRQVNHIDFATQTGALNSLFTNTWWATNLLAASPAPPTNPF